MGSTTVDQLALNDAFAITCAFVSLCAAVRMTVVAVSGRVDRNTAFWCWGITLAALGMGFRPLYWGVAGLLASHGYHIDRAYDMRWLVWPSVVVAIVGYTLHLREPLRHYLGPMWVVLWSAFLTTLTALLYAVGMR